MSTTRQVPRSRGPLSTVLDRIPPEKRIEIDRALLDPNPIPVKEIIARFDITGCGVSKPAFYRYAARLRSNAALNDAAELALTPGADPFESMNTFLTSEFMKVFAEGSGSTDPDDDPTRIPDKAFARLGRITLMFQRLTKIQSAATRRRKSDPTAASAIKLHGPDNALATPHTRPPTPDSR